MVSPKFIEIDGKQHLWRDILQIRRDQLIAITTTKQFALFELRDDSRPALERRAADRFLQPSLLNLLDDIPPSTKLTRESEESHET